MTRRERLEARLEKRRIWAESRRAKAATAFDTAWSLVKDIPMGQPILVGHHSEARHRRTLERSDNAMRRACESQDMAAHHDQRADGIEAALDRSIYSDDADAVQQLENRIADRMAERERMKLVNKAHAKFIKTGMMPDGLTEAEQAMIRNYKPAYSWEPRPYPPYSFSNLGGRIQADKKRLESIKIQNARHEAAEAADKGFTITGTDYVAVTFAEKPDREILDALKAAGFRWSRGSWYGYRASLPSALTA